MQEEVPGEVNQLLIKFLKDGLPRVPENLAAGPKASVPNGTR